MYDDIDIVSVAKQHFSILCSELKCELEDKDYAYSRYIYDIRCQNADGMINAYLSMVDISCIERDELNKAYKECIAELKKIHSDYKKKLDDEV